MNRIILSVIMDIMSDLTRMQKTVHGRSIHLVAAKRIFNNVFLCEWGDYSVTGNDGLKVTSKKRDIVLTLDISASMDGIPLDETKKLQQNLLILFLIKIQILDLSLIVMKQQVFLVFAVMMFLKNTITSLSSAENTNIEDGLSRAYSMLQLGQSKETYCFNE